MRGYFSKNDYRIQRILSLSSVFTVIFEESAMIYKII